MNYYIARVSINGCPNFFTGRKKSSGQVYNMKYELPFSLDKNMAATYNSMVEAQRACSYFIDYKRPILKPFLSQIKTQKKRQNKKFSMGFANDWIVVFSIALLS